jgi:hypothetical protein
MTCIARTAAIAFAALAIYCAPSAALACKDRLYPARFQVEELANYDNVCVVHVVGIERPNAHAICPVYCPQLER